MASFVRSIDPPRLQLAPFDVHASVAFHDAQELLPFGRSNRSKSSVRGVSALYGTPFLRRYPGFRPVVTTFSDPPRGAGPGKMPPARKVAFWRGRPGGAPRLPD